MRVLRATALTIWSPTFVGADGETPVTTFSTRGCIGTIKTLREETTLTSRESRERSLMVQVLWDNGTLSYLGPEGLEMASK